MKRLTFPFTFLLALLAGSVLFLLGGCRENAALNPFNPPSTLVNGPLYYTRLLDPVTSAVMTVDQDGGRRGVLLPGDAMLRSAPQAHRMLVSIFDSTVGRQTLVIVDLEGTILDTIPTREQAQIAFLSPDAATICYGYWDYMNHPGRQTWTLHLVRADGTGDVEFTTDACFDAAVTFSPDSRRLLFYTDEQYPAEDKLWIINSDGTGRRMLTENAASMSDGFGDAAWSSVRDLIFFMRRDPADPDRYDIWRINPDGSDLRNLTADVDIAMAPSVRTTTLAFSGAEVGRSASLDIWVMDLDGRNRRVLAGTAVGEEIEIRPQISPDGRVISCLSIDSPDSLVSLATGRLKVVDVESGAATYLTDGSDIYNAYWAEQ